MELVRRTTHGYVIWCPGCAMMHHIATTPNGWTFNDNLEAPTFAPSVLIRHGHFAEHYKRGDPCWCRFNEDAVKNGQEPSHFVCNICHFFITDGRITYCGDSTHALSGQTVPLQSLPK